ncbi:MAG: hypothetical protein KDB53_04865 [Planctomycetes bacterium]|nr:hypothetical protein [Planctomycetota bacterium]
MSSPAGTLDPQLAILVAQEVSPSLAAPFLLAGPAPLGWSAFTLAAVVPPGLEGLRLRIQGYAASSTAANGFCAASDAHQIEVIPAN